MAPRLQPVQQVTALSAAGRRNTLVNIRADKHSKGALKIQYKVCACTSVHHRCREEAVRGEWWPGGGRAKGRQERKGRGKQGRAEFRRDPEIHSGEEAGRERE